MRPDLEGRVAVVTGGASGLGLAAARRLVAAGARVTVLDRDEAALARAAETGLRTIPADVTDRAGLDRAVETIEAQEGEIAVLVTAAGVLDPPRPPEKITQAAWDRIFSVNLEGTRHACELVGARMAARGRGSIVTVASITGMEPGPLTIYGPSKAAVIALTRALAGAWGRQGVRVNAVAPGYVHTPALERGLSSGFLNERHLTDATALGRLARAEEVAEAILFLASDAAAAITGIVLPVDAGQLLAGGHAPFGGFGGVEA